MLSCTLQLLAGAHSGEREASSSGRVKEKRKHFRRSGRWSGAAPQEVGNQNPCSSPARARLSGVADCRVSSSGYAPRCSGYVSVSATSTR